VTRPARGGKPKASGQGEHEELRRWREPATFTTLKKGGIANDYHVEAIAYCGGKLFEADKEDEDKTPRPYRVLHFRQQRG
jgi:hypothetical protein